MRGAALHALACLPAALGAGPARGGGVVPLTSVHVAGGLDRPVFVTHAPGDGSRLFIVEQRGVIKSLDLATGALRVFLDIDALVGGPGNDADERGLLGLAFHPDHAANGFFFVNYTDNNSDTVVARYSVSADPGAADPASAVPILAIDQPNPNHSQVAVSDFLDLLAHWGPCPASACAWDLDRDGAVGTTDFLALLAQWGPLVTP